MDRVKGLKLFEDFITPTEERELLAHIDSGNWDLRLSRRTQHYGYIYDYTKKSAAERADPIPEWCASVVERVAAEFTRQPDQLIINEYKPGQGIAPHTDDVRSFGGTVVSLSLGSDVVMDLSKPGDDPVAVKLPRRSLLVLTGDARYVWRHGIASRKKDGNVARGRRVSMTFREMMTTGSNKRVKMFEIN